MKLYETLFRHKKINGFVFRKKEGVAPTKINRPPTATKNLVEGVEFASSDIRYRDRPVQGYQIIFDSTKGVGEENKMIEIEELRQLKIEEEKKQLEIEEKKKLQIEQEKMKAALEEQRKKYEECELEQAKIKKKIAELQEEKKRTEEKTAAHEQELIELEKKKAIYRNRGNKIY